MVEKELRPKETIAIVPVYAHGALFEIIKGEVHITSYVNQPDLAGEAGATERVAVSRLIFSEANFWKHSHAVRKITRPDGTSNN